MKLTLVLIAACLSAAAQTRPAPRAATAVQESAEYRLTLPQFRKYMEANRAMAKAFQDPATQAWAKQYRATHKDDGDLMSNGRTLAESARYIDANLTPVAKAIRSSGLSIEEYLQITFTYFGAAMADGMMRAYNKMEVPKGIAGENIAFIQKNRAELEAFQKEFAEAQKQFKALNGDTDDSGDSSDEK